MSRLIYVPKTMEAMFDAEYGRWDSVGHYVWQLTDADFEALWDSGIFQWLNTKLNLLIDDYEDQDIFYQQLFFIQEDLYNKINAMVRQTEAARLREMIEHAIGCRTLLSIVL